MKVDDSLIDKLAELARLDFNAASRTQIKEDLQRMLVFVEKLNELNLDGIEPLIYISDSQNVLAEDSAKQLTTKEEALKNAPLHNSDYFKVPKVLSK